MRKYIKNIFILIILLFIILNIAYSYPRKLSREYHGVMYRLGNNNYSESVKISINGYLSKGLIKGDKFEGNIVIGDKRLSKINMRFDNVGRGLLLYFDESTGDYASYGDIYANKIVEKFTICVLEEDEQRKGGKTWTGNDGLMISAPADSRDEALEISNNLMRFILIDKELK